MQIKRACIISKFLYENDTRLQQQAKTLKTSNFKVDVLCLYANHNSTRIEEGINIFGVSKPTPKDTIIKYLWSTIKFAGAVFFKLQNLASKEKYDLIVVHTLPEFLIFTTYFQKNKGTKLLLDVRDTSVELFDSKWGNGKRRLLKKLVKKSADLSCKYADKIITASPGFQEKLIERNVPKEKINIIYNSADTKIFKFDAERKFEKISSNAKLIYHGTIAERFGIDIAIEALALVQSKIPNSELHVYGFYDDEYKLKLQKIIDIHNLHNLVFLNGKDTLENIYMHIKNSDIGIVPYRSDEFMQLALSTKMFEYVASGIPVVAARLKPAEYVLNDDCVSYSSPDKAQEFANNIEQLCLYPELRKSLVEKAFIAHKKISGDVMSQLYLDIVQDLISR